MIIDSHCHLNYEPMSLSLKETIDRANRDGVNYLLTISTEDKSFDKILNIISNNKCVFGSYGIHPHEAKNHQSIKSDDIIKKTKLNKKIIGIGESGLDFYYNHSDKKDQIKCFEEHITAAQITQLPLIVHTRDAEKDTIFCIKNGVKKFSSKGLIHCFTSTKEFAKLVKKRKTTVCFNIFLRSSMFIQDQKISSIHIKTRQSTTICFGRLALSNLADTSSMLFSL